MEVKLIWNIVIVEKHNKVLLQPETWITAVTRILAIYFKGGNKAGSQEKIKYIY